MGGVYLFPVAVATAVATKEVTGLKAGNAGINEEIERSCQTDSDPERCKAQWQPDDRKVRQAVIDAPIIEETLFRAVPSVITDLTDDDRSLRKIGANLLHGTESKKLTRKELIAGFASSTLFAAAHGMTARGYDTQTIPIPQGVAGFGFWYLARKHGIGSSMVAHSTFNAIPIGLMRILGK